MKSAFPALLGLALVLGTGCGEVMTVSGTVTEEGKPVQSATILFVPKTGTKGPTVSGKITKGRYRIPAKDGLQPGDYIVKVKRGVPPRRFQRPLIPDQAFEFDRQIKDNKSRIDLEL